MKGRKIRRMIKAQFKFEGDPVGTLSNLREAVQNRIVRKALNKAKIPVKQAVKANASGIKRFGFLAKTIGDRVKTYEGGGRVVAVIGPKRDSVFIRGVYTRGKHRGEARKIIPANYAHLVEKGTKRARKKPFISPVLDSTQARYFEMMKNGIAEGIATELNKGKK